MWFLWYVLMPIGLTLIVVLAIIYIMFLRENYPIFKKISTYIGYAIFTIAVLAIMWFFGILIGTGIGLFRI